jgi:CRISPR-associated protein Cst2
MAFLTGLMLIDAPASALNNAGADDNARTDNAVATKVIRAGSNWFPYVSAQAFRYWLRTTLQHADVGWQAAPIYREQKVAYTDANPLQWWDDDLFGYMRAPSKRTDAVQRRQQDPSRAGETETKAEITRISPFRVSTLVAIAPTRPTSDFGTMSRHEGDPVPHEHQFYRTVLKGLVSLDLHAAGTFSFRNRTGFRNLDEIRVELAKRRGLESLEAEQSYRLPVDERAARVAALVRALGVLAGGAKQSIHYTDVIPSVVLAMVTRGGNNPLQYIIGADSTGLPHVHTEAPAEMVRVWGDQMLSPLYVGWVQGFHDAQRERLVQQLDELNSEGASPRLPRGYLVAHPREALSRCAADLEQEASAWMA